MTSLSVEMSPEMAELKKRLKATWMSGDYGYFATYLYPGAADFISRIDFETGTRILDVACGAGQISIPLARRGAIVTGIDLAGNLIEQARARAKAEKLDIRFDEGDAEMLPYEDHSFDMVISLIGAMFAPRPELVAAEFIRVCRPGGKIIMGNWTPNGFVGKMFKAQAAHVPMPAFMAPPVKWGDEATVRERFKDGIAQLEFQHHLYPFRYPFPPAEVVEFFRNYYGPTYKAFAGLDAEKQTALARDLEQVWAEHNTAKDGTTALESDYLEVVAIRQ